MRKVDRSELLTLGAYEQIRDRFRSRIIELKSRRRLALGEHMTLLFENHDTALLQVQEMLRTERISDERSIAHELDTYNELLPGAYGLSATLFIEYEDPAQRRIMLGKLATMRSEVRLRLGGREHVARFATHFGEELDRLPAVNYLTFELGPDSAAKLRDPNMAVAVAVTHPDYDVAVALPAPMREELAVDLSS